MEEIVKKINKLDLSFEKTDYHEIEFCSDKCIDDLQTPKLTEKEEKCFRKI